MFRILSNTNHWYRWLFYHVMLGVMSTYDSLFIIIWFYLFAISFLIEYQVYESKEKEKLIEELISNIGVYSKFKDYKEFLTKEEK